MTAPPISTENILKSQIWIKRTRTRSFFMGQNWESNSVPRIRGKSCDAVTWHWQIFAPLSQEKAYQVSSQLSQCYPWLRLQTPQNQSSSLSHSYSPCQDHCWFLSREKATNGSLQPLNPHIYSLNIPINLNILDHHWITFNHNITSKLYLL